MTDETLFAAALESPDRAAFLAASCPDPEQRRRIDRLLDAHDRASGFLRNPAVVNETRTHAPDGDDSETRDGNGDHADHDLEDALGFLAPATRPDSLGRIGHYEVLEVLGRGGFGIVFRAFDVTLQRVVAVKVLAPSMAATSPARKRFLREARASAAVRHEHVVQVHAVNEQPLPHLVMEFVPGETLQQRIDRTGPLDSAEVLRIGRQVAEGLAAAHATGVVHRDIKPANVLIEGGAGRAKITDFGLARAADDASLTRSGVVAGTPLFMAPEQAKGEALDHRADLFSLGSLLYATLTGRPPFRAESTLGVLKRVADDTPRPIREVIPETPEWFCRIVEKLHEKNPADRFQTAREVADVLADCERQLAAHKELKDYSRIPGGGRPKRCGPRLGRRKWAAAVALALAFVGFWFGRNALLYANNQGEVELLPQEGLVSIIVLKDDRGEFDDNDPKVRAVTDWIGMKKPHALKLPPGKYKLNAGTWPARAEVGQWEVDLIGPIGSTHLLMSGRSLIFDVERGKRVRIRPVVWHKPDPPAHTSGTGTLVVIPELPAHVRVEDLSPAKRTLHDAQISGELTLSTTPAGEYRVHATRNGAVVFSQTVRLIEGDRLEVRIPNDAPPPAARQPVSLRKFDPAKDKKPEPPRGGASLVTVEDGAWRIENDTNTGNFHVHVATLTDGIPDDGLIVFRAKVKTKMKNPTGWGSLQLGDDSPGGHGYDWPRDLYHYAGDNPDWTEKEVRYPASAFRKKNPPSIAVYVGLHSDGVVWVKDAELLHIPADPKTAAALKALRDAVAAKTRTLELVTKRYEAGVVNKTEWLQAQAEVTEARVALAEAEGDKAAVVARLEELVKFRQEERDLVAERVNAGIDRIDLLNKADSRLAGAKVRLAKVKPPALPEPGPGPRTKP